MRKSGKKLVALGLSAVLLSNALAACSGGTAEESTTGVATTGGNTTGTQASNEETSASESQVANTSSVKAGTYEASAAGYGGDVTVTLTVEEDGSVSSLDINADTETEDIGQLAAPQLAEDIVAYQSLALDAVAGATLTSTAVFTATEDALSQAGVDVEAWKNKTVEKEVGEAEEVSVDIVVVGAGGSGTGAALAAAEAGADVLIIEKLGSVGGNSKLASGFFAVGSKWQEEAGVVTDVDTAVNRLLEFNNYLSNGPLTRAIVEKAADTVEWLEGYGMEFYLQMETTQFAHEGDDYEARSYHKYVDSLAGFEAIYEELDQMGAELRLNTTFTGLIQDEDGTVKGIIATKEDGGQLTVNAKAVIMATGGFGGDVEKAYERVNSDYLASIGMPNNGEGLEALVEAGGIDIDGTPLLHACQLAEAEVKQDSHGDNLAGYSSSSLTQLLMSPLLWVDGSGSRFVNEDVVYDTAFWANAAVAAGGKYYFIVDEATLQSYTDGDTLRLSYAGPGPSTDPADFVELADAAVEGGTVFKGSNVEELAAATGMDAEDLQATIDRYNSMVESGVDTDYNKSSESLKFTVGEGNLYAFDCRAVFLGTIGGVKVDEKLQVIDNDYNAIPGLYAVGTNAGGYYNGLGYPPFEGLACGFAWTSGRIAGENAATYVK